MVDAADRAPIERVLVLVPTYDERENLPVIVEHPIRFSERELGTSKMSGNIISEALLAVAGWGLELRREQAGHLLSRVRARRS